MIREPSVRFKESAARDIRTQRFNLINERQLRGKGTVISTNLNVEELRRRYTERITSRLLDGKQCMLLQFLGDDVRRNKA